MASRSIQIDAQLCAQLDRLAVAMRRDGTPLERATSVESLANAILEDGLRRAGREWYERQALARAQKCPVCHGTGRDPLSDNLNCLPCGTCHATGHILAQIEEARDGQP